MDLTPGEINQIIDAISRELPACRYKAAFHASDFRDMAYGLRAIDALIEQNVLIIGNGECGVVIIGIAPCKVCGWDKSKTSMFHRPWYAHQSLAANHLYDPFGPGPESAES